MKRLLLASTMMLLPTLAHAGVQATDTANCVVHTDGSGFCSGTLAGFRNSSGGGDYAGFQVSTINRFFQASFGGKYFMCVSSTDVPGGMDQQGWVAASATRSFFVQWDKAGNCIDVATYNYSYNR
jgi:hypothetical protein